MSSDWEKTCTCHVLRVGQFQLCVWPVMDCGSFESWVEIYGMADAGLLPCPNSLPTVELAKDDVITRFRALLTDTLEHLPGEER